MNAPKLTTSLELVRWIGWAQMKAGEDWIPGARAQPSAGLGARLPGAEPGCDSTRHRAGSRTSAASVTSLLQGLERRGLVERRTEQGNERSKRVYAALHRLLSKITAELPQPTRS
jgi:hypothetical protein